MALSAKPTSYTVNTGHAKCPDHLYMLDDATGGTTAADGVGSLDLTVDSTAMWATDGTYGQILRFVSASLQKALSGNTFSATSGLCFVFAVKSASATNPAANQSIGGAGHSATANTYATSRFTTAGYLNGVARYNGGTTWTATSAVDVYDDAWHLVAIKVSQSTGTDGEIRQSVDGSSWGYGTEVTAHDMTTLGFNRVALGCLPTPTPSTYLDGDILAASVYVDDYGTWDDAWIASLYSDPWQFLSSSTTKCLKLLTHADAQSKTGVAGVVFEAPAGSDLTGAKIGEFTAQAFEATLEGGEAVLLVDVADFGGSALTTSDTPRVEVRYDDAGTIKGTAIVPATVVEI